MQDLFENFKDKRAVVTGGAGFIGSHICEALVQAGCFVISVDDFSAGKPHNLNALKDFGNFRVVQADVCDELSMSEILSQGIDYVFHNAASKKTVCLQNPLKDLKVNAGGTLTLLQLAVKHKVKKFVHASTGSVYGEPKIFPSDESHPLNPVSYYGVSKLAGEKYVQTFHHLYGLNTTILRYFHVYGPRQESNEFGGVVSIFLRNILDKKDLVIYGDGSQVRSFTWVKDIANANLLTVVNSKSCGEVYNCASGIQITIQELATKIAKMIGQGRAINIRHEDWTVGDIKYFAVSNRKIKDHLGLEFTTDFWNKMSETIDDFVAYLKKYELRVV
ncbi:MAG: SDR family NAD(P)-dependent oxidoreductase [Deltaproteobacteria bacterium]|nr:SDR family NAD(P)-dependent oxidoreductase [Deltaproteobacteria bacterium]